MAAPESLGNCHIIMASVKMTVAVGNFDTLSVFLVMWFEILNFLTQ